MMLGFTQDAHPRKSVLVPDKATAIVSPSDSRDTRVLLYFSLDNIPKSNVTVDFALLRFRAELKDAVVCQIDAYPVTKNWYTSAEVSWTSPWDNDGGDYIGSYSANNCSVKQEWGKKDLSIDVTEIVRNWATEEMNNNGIIIRISSDDLEKSVVTLQFMEGSIELMLYYSYTIEKDQ